MSHSIADMLDPSGRFVFTGITSRVIFGHGTMGELPAEIERLGLRRILILSTPPQARQAEALRQTLGARCAAVFAGAVMHTPADVTVNAMQVVRDHAIDGVLAVGGGSTTGLAKAIAYRTDLPQIICPTTYAGSEMTPILGETENGLKVTRRDPKILPEVVIYDVDQTLSLPAALSVTSGMNAIAHAVEALYAPDANPVISLMAQEGIAALVRALPLIHENPTDGRGRVDALYGAWLSGICLGAVGMSLHHKLCHTLGGTFNLPHAETHTAILPHALHFNAAAVPRAIATIGKVMNTDAPAQALFDLASGLGATMSLAALGMPQGGIEKAVELSMKNTYANPRPLQADAIRHLLEQAWHGQRPG